MAKTVIFTDDELKVLFPNQIQRDVFIEGMKRLFEVISERTVNVPFVQLNRVEY